MTKRTHELPEPYGRLYFLDDPANRAVWEVDGKGVCLSHRHWSLLFRAAWEQDTKRRAYEDARAAASARVRKLNADGKPKGDGDAV